jgi:hypothetical protein
MSIIDSSTANVTDLESVASGGSSTTQSQSALGGTVQNSTAVPCTTLIFNAISVTEITGGLVVNFVCPVCGATWSLTIMFDDYDGSGTYDMNELIAITYPDHDDSSGNDCTFSNTVINLNLEAHLDGTVGFCFCMQASPISDMLNKNTGEVISYWWQAGEVFLANALRTKHIAFAPFVEPT